MNPVKTNAGEAAFSLHGMTWIKWTLNTQNSSGSAPVSHPPRNNLSMRQRPFPHCTGCCRNAILRHACLAEDDNVLILAWSTLLCILLHCISAFEDRPLALLACATG